MAENVLTSLPKVAFDLLDFWVNLRGDAPVPHKRSLNPLAMRRWISDLSIVEVHEGDKQFFIKLHGTNTSHQVGANFHKMYLEDALPPQAAERGLEPYILSQIARKPTYSLLLPGALKGVFRQFERLVLPFSDSDDGETVDRFLVWVGASSCDTLQCSSVYDAMADDDKPNMNSTLAVIDYDEGKAEFVLPNTVKRRAAQAA